VGQVQHLQGFELVTVVVDRLEDLLVDVVVGQVDVAHALQEVSHLLETYSR
jgi:hypothetical protein